MDFDKFRTQLEEIKTGEPDQYFYVDDQFGSVRFSWDQHNNHYQIVHGVGLVTFFDDFTVKDNGSFISFFRWMKYKNVNDSEVYIQSVTAMMVFGETDNHIVGDIVKKVKE